MQNRPMNIGIRKEKLYPSTNLASVSTQPVRTQNLLKMCGYTTLAFRLPLAFVVQVCTYTTLTVHEPRFCSAGKCLLNSARRTQNLLKMCGYPTLAFRPPFHTLHLQKFDFESGCVF